MDVRRLVRQIGEREPLNPYQVAGIAAVIRQSGVRFDDGTLLRAENLGRVLMVLDRTGEDASIYLVDVRQEDSLLTLYTRFPRESLENLTWLTGFKGRRQAIGEHLIPVLDDIPNWVEVVRVLSRYSLDRDDESLGDRLQQVMEIILGFLFAATTQPFDAEARSEGEYVLSRLVESILKSTDDARLRAYIPFVERGLHFLSTNLFCKPINSLERRVLEISGIRSALRRRSDNVKGLLEKRLYQMEAQALLTALDEIRACPATLVAGMDEALSRADFPGKEIFEADVAQKIRLHTAEELERRKAVCRGVLLNGADSGREELSGGIDFIRGISEEWRGILTAFQGMVDLVPVDVQAVFAEILATQISETAKPEVKEILIEGVCRIVVRLEQAEKLSSKRLIDTLATLFLNRAYSSDDRSEVISSLKAIESLGVTLGRKGYYLLSQVLLDHILRRPLIRPLESKYTVEDDDTGEPLVLAEEAGANAAHAQHIKSLLAIVASNPRLMHRLVPYLVVQVEIGNARLCDEDLIQYSISSLLRANSSITHFLVRTLIKALPYSFKDIGPLDTLRLTAAGLAKELANRGVRPIGNFLGKLRGDIHWRGSIENFFFAQGIVKYFATGDPQAVSEWMPRESLPYLAMHSWCTDEEAQGIRELSNRIFSDLNIDPGDKDGMMALVSLDTSVYCDDPTWPEFARYMVLDVIELVKGLHKKYFVVTEQAAGSTIKEDLNRLNSIVVERQKTKEEHLIPDLRDPLPLPVTLTEGVGEYVQEMDRIRAEQPSTPIILRAKKAGHAYAQKATYIEGRFEAFNEDLGLEALQETLATSINNIHFNEITFENLRHALTFLDELTRGVSVNGHSSYYLRRSGHDLLIAGKLGLTLDKVRDLLKMIKKELDDVHTAYRAWFEEPIDHFL
ncbi:MAG: hypothetical protein FJY85_01375, partial [Deltaproteobacteria bacterium]|nr:hypothetical protein [Deltaproteobacteria bacterium]